MTYITQFNLTTARTKNYGFIVLSGEVGAAKLQIIFPNVHSWEEADSYFQKERIKGLWVLYDTMKSLRWNYLWNQISCSHFQTINIILIRISCISWWASWQLGCTNWTVKLRPTETTPVCVVRLLLCHNTQSFWMKLKCISLGWNHEHLSKLFCTELPSFSQLYKRSRKEMSTEWIKTDVAFCVLSTKSLLFSSCQCLSITSFMS